MKFQISKSQVQAKVQGAWDKGLYALSTEILADCNEYCKEDQHTLINSSMAHSQRDKGILVWQTPYAKRQYWGIKTSLTPGRTWKWCETAKRKHLSEWKAKAQRAVDMNL